MKINNPEKRLNKFWGKVDNKHILSVYPFLKGKNILDVGCGIGTTTDYISKNNKYNCIGIDNNSEEIGKAKILSPLSNFKIMDCKNLQFEDGFFDTIILRDVLHHLYEESDFEEVKKKLERVSHKNTRIIVLDPNVNALIRIFRIISSHKDAECKFEDARLVIKSMGYSEFYHSFHTLYSLPLSGGYVGINFVPQIKWIQKLILLSESFFEKIIRFFNLGRYACWRYIIVGDKKTCPC